MRVPILILRRTMALIDLHNELTRINSVPAPPLAATANRRPIEALGYTDEGREKTLTIAVLKALLDPIGEVKNMAVSW